MNMNRMRDWREFGLRQREAVDIDPLYPVLREVFQPLPAEEKLWSVLVYVAYYNLPSAMTALSDTPPFTVPDGALSRLPTGIERRGLRGGEPLVRHLNSVLGFADYFGGFDSFLQHGWTGAPLRDWMWTRYNAEQVWGNGRWASYKLAEILQKVLDWPIFPPNMGMDRASGPRQCIDMLWDDHVDAPECESRGRTLRIYAREGGLYVDLAEVETVLCDFGSAMKGRYYPGHDVALLHDDIRRMPDGDPRLRLEAAAVSALPERYWRPIEPALKRLYRDTGEIWRGP